MIARDIMTREVITMDAETDVLEAIDILVNNRISGAPVIDKDGAINGVVTEKDLLIALDFLGDRDASEVLVAEFMTRDVISFAEDTPVKSIMQELVRHNIKRVPIVTGNKIVGIIARRDILKNVKKA